MSDTRQARIEAGADALEEKYDDLVLDGGPSSEYFRVMAEACLDAADAAVAPAVGVVIDRGDLEILFEAAGNPERLFKPGWIEVERRIDALLTAQPEPDENAAPKSVFIQKRKDWKP